MLIDTLIRLVEWLMAQLQRLMAQLQRLDFYLLVSRLPLEERARLAAMMRAMIARQGKGA